MNPEQLNQHIDGAIRNAKAIKEKFIEVANVKSQETEKLYRQAKHFDAIADSYSDLKTALEKTPKENFPFLSISSGDTAIRVFREFVESKKNEEFNLNLLSGLLSTSSTLGSTVISIYQSISPGAQGYYCQILNNQDLSIRNFVRSKLPSDISRTFAQAWQSLEQGSYDPERGAAFLMRGVVSHFLWHYAPAFDVKNQSWFVPNEDSDDGITRNHRIRFIVESFFSKEEWEYKRELLRHLDHSYKDFSEAHKRGELNKIVYESYLNAVTNTLYSFYFELEKQPLKVVIV